MVGASIFVLKNLFFLGLLILFFASMYVNVLCVCLVPSVCRKTVKDGCYYSVVPSLAVSSSTKALTYSLIILNGNFQESKNCNFRNIRGEIWTHLLAILVIRSSVLATQDLHSSSL